MDALLPLSRGSFHSYYQAWNSQEDIFFFFKYNFDCIWLKEGSHIHLGWFEGEFNKISIFR